jgi:hypothetical protein
MLLNVANRSLFSYFSLSILFYYMSPFDNPLQISYAIGVHFQRS